MTVRLQDAADRSRAATDFDTNLVVSAGAGTGKTSLLVERILNVVGSGVATIDRLAAITFTEKAAGEMRERVASGLDRLRGLARAEGEPDATDEAGRSYAHLVGTAGATPEQIARRALAAMEQLDHATLTTIHGFCAELLRGYPVEAGVDPDFAVDTGEKAESIRHEVWERFLSRELGPEAQRGELWRKLVADPGLPVVGAVAMALADFDVPEALPGKPLPETAALLSRQADELIAGIDSLLARQSGLTAGTVSWFDFARAAIAALRTDGVAGFERQLRTNPTLRIKVADKRDPQPTKALLGVGPEEMKALSRRTGKWLRALMRLNEPMIRLILDAAAPFPGEFRDAFLRQGFVSFDGLLALARDLLRDHPEVRRELKRRYAMLLVDEFQDTDPVQHEIVLFLAERPEDEQLDAYEARLGPGRLFAVGDAKQSIYRFRGADYDAYRRAVERLVAQGGVELNLTGNFRSVPGLIEPINRLLQSPDGCWQPSGYQPEYLPIQPVREQDDAEPRVELWTIDIGDKAMAEERREMEGRLLADAIRQLVADGRCRYEQITLLFRAFTRISHYLRPMRERGIPFVVDGGREFLNRPEVGQLMATLRTLAQPLDAPALLSFLRSPAGGVSDAELADYAATKGIWDWRRPPAAERFPRIATALERLRELSRQTKHLPADAVVRRVLEGSYLLPLGAAAFEGAQRVANLSKLAAAASELARDGRLSLDEVVQALAQGRLADIKTDRPLSDDAAQAVRITSIHRMKGLENDWIFLPDLARQEGRSTDDATARVVHPDGGPAALAVHAAVTRPGFTTNGPVNAARVWLDVENEQHSRAEEVRVLYVALTRARERLVVLAGPSRGEAPWLKALEPWGYDAKNPPRDAELLCDGQVLHRIPLQGPRLRLGRPRSVSESARCAERYEAAVRTLRQASRPQFETPSGGSRSRSVGGGRAAPRAGTLAPCRRRLPGADVAGAVPRRRPGQRRRSRRALGRGRRRRCLVPAVRSRPALLRDRHSRPGDPDAASTGKWSGLPRQHRSAVPDKGRRACRGRLQDRQPDRRDAALRKVSWPARDLRRLREPRVEPESTGAGRAVAAAQRRSSAHTLRPWG